MIVKDMQDILNSYKSTYDGIWDEYDKAHALYQQERMTGRVLDEHKKERAEKLAELYRTTSDQITAALGKYVDALPTRYAKDPEQVDANALAMLNSAAAGVVELSGSDLERLFEKFNGNLTMQAIVANFASEHDNDARITFYSEKQRKADAENYAGGVRGCLSKDTETRNSLPLSFAYYSEGTRAVPASLQSE